MARLTVVAKTPPGSYPVLPLVAGSADLAFTPAGASFAEGFQVAFAGDLLLIVKNGNIGPQTVTIESVADEKNRKGDITAYSIGAGEYAVFGPFERPGWAQTGLLLGACSAADMEIAAINLN